MRLAIEHLCVFGMPPVEFVHFAADLGCSGITLSLEPPRVNPHRYAAWSLRKDAALRRATIAAMQERGIAHELGYALAALPNIEMRSFAADLELLCELQVKRLAVVSAEPDLERGLDQLAIAAEMAQAVGLDAVLEFSPTTPIADLPTALVALRHVGRANFKLVIDTMHFSRSGATPADLAALSDHSIGFVQLSDAPLRSTHADYIREARYERLPPGHGELPLSEVLAVLPRTEFGLEVPQRALAEAGVLPRERLQPCVDATLALLRANLIAFDGQAPKPEKTEAAEEH